MGTPLTRTACQMKRDTQFSGSVKIRNEINDYLEGRYLSACESMWRIYSFDVHYNSPAVHKFLVHLPGEEVAVFNEDENLKSVEIRYNHGRTMLTEWFEMNRQYPETRQLKYIEMLTMYVWDTSNKLYSLRKQKGTIGRLVNIHLHVGQRYYLRFLVSFVKGPTCYNDLYTWGGTTYETFQAACFAKGLLNGDKEWHDTLTESSQFYMPRSLRRMFVLILIFCHVSDPSNLWQNNWPFMAEDILRQQRRVLRFPTLQLTPQELENYTLIEVERLLQSHDTSLVEFKGMPLPSQSIMDDLRTQKKQNSTIVT